MVDRKAIPPQTCDYLIRMHLSSVEAISKYMSAGCQASGLHDSLSVNVELIRLRDAIENILDQYSSKRK